MNTKKIFTTTLKSLFVVILFSIFTGCNVIKTDLLLPQLMVLRKALATVGLATDTGAGNPNTPTTPTAPVTPNTPALPTCSEIATVTITAPRFISLSQQADMKAVVDKAGYSFSWTQISGDTVSLLNANTDTASFIPLEVPQESPKFQVIAKKYPCSFSSEVIVTPLELTANPVYVDVTYAGGSSDGSLEKPYTDVATAYSLAPGAIYITEGDYPISALLNMVNSHSIYGGFNSKFERKVSAYTTTLNDTRNGISSIYTLDTNTADTGTRLDGLTILGPANGDWASVLHCNSGTPKLSNLNIWSQGISPTGNTYTVYIAPGCSAILEKNNIKANVSTTGSCIGIYLYSITARLKENKIYGNAGCGHGAQELRIENATNFNLSDPNFIDAVGGGNTSYPMGINIYNSPNSVLSNQDISAGEGGTIISVGIQVQLSSGLTIKNNIIYSGSGSTSSAIGIHLPSLSGSIKINGNTIYTKYRTGNSIPLLTAVGINIQSDQPHEIINNLVLNAPSTGDNYGILIDNAGTMNPIIVNNTVMSSTAGTNWSRAIQIRGGAKPIIANNILFSDNINGSGFSEWDGSSDPIRFENNLLFNVPVGLFYNEGGGYVNTDIAINALGDIAIVGSNMTTSPQTNYPLTSIFIDPANGDYRLKTGSPYLTAGKNVYNDPIYGSITTNRNGTPRPSSGSWSVGAY
ncbi:MAG: hypothetical protein IPO06_31020 [Leptospiraceae bacterium]|nr:hypothetical protein [Leptospiraceae bacterium]